MKSFASCLAIACGAAAVHLDKEFSFAQVATDTEIRPCLQINSFDYNATAFQPIMGGPIALQRVRFTMYDDDACYGEDKDLSLFVVFSTPDTVNQAWEYTQQDLHDMRASEFEITVENTAKLVCGYYGVSVEIRDNTGSVVRASEAYSVYLSTFGEFGEEAYGHAH